KAQKELDMVTDWSIIVFTTLEASRAADGRPRQQAQDASTTGNAEPAPQSRTRRTVSPRRFLRFSRSGPGQVRDVAPGPDRRPLGDGCDGQLRLFATLFLSGAIGLRARRSGRSGASQARSQAGVQAYRGGPHIHRGDSPERTVHTIAGSGETDPGTLRHQGSSTQHRAQPAAPSKKTPLNGASHTSATRQDLAAHYEQLRRDAMGRSSSGG